MNLLAKIENFINSLLIRLGDLFLKLSAKFMPAWLLGFFERLKSFLLLFTPEVIKEALTALKNRMIKAMRQVFSSDYKGKLRNSLQEIKASYKSQNLKGMRKIKALVLVPVTLFSQWFQGLTGPQAIILLVFTAGSIFASLQVVSSWQNIITESAPTRSPASVNEEVEYERPGYYKKETRHILVSSVRLPVYLPRLNELRSVDLDFNVTLSNRESRQALEKLELQLRDHIILSVEPSLASFSLQEEGKQIMKEKIWKEIDHFLSLRGINGHVKELKLTYILAN